MAEYTETSTPYEFLVRWNEAGELQGMHYQEIKVGKVDGNVVLRALGPVAPVKDGAVPLEAVLGRAFTDMAKALEVKDEVIADLQYELEMMAPTPAQEALELELSAKRDQLQVLAVENARLQAELAVAKAHAAE